MRSTEDCGFSTLITTFLIFFSFALSTNTKRHAANTPSYPKVIVVSDLFIYHKSPAGSALLTCN